MKKLPIKTPMPPASVPHARPAANPQADRLPPHSLEAEKSALGCLIQEPALMESCKNIRPELFYDLRNEEIFTALKAMYQRQELIDLVTLVQTLKDAVMIEKVGGVSYVSSLTDTVTTTANLPYYLKILKEKHALRMTIRLCTETIGRAFDAPGDVENLMLGVRADLETVTSLGVEDKAPVLKIWRAKEIMAHKIPTHLRLVGDNEISKGREGITLIAGPGSAGKSLAASALALAGAMGKGLWQGRPVHRQFKTLFLQAENGSSRIKGEIEAMQKNHPKVDIEGHIFISEPPEGGLPFHHPEFRAAVRQQIDALKPDLVVLDPWSQVAADDSAKDVVDKINEIRSCFPSGDDCPGLLIVAHTKKPRPEDVRRGRALTNLVSGSIALPNTARCVYVLLPWTEDLEDDRIYWACCKLNNGQMYAPTVWHRRFGTFFEHDNETDPQMWGKEEKQEEDQLITYKDLALAFGQEKAMKKSDIARKLEVLTGCSYSTGMRVIVPGRNGYLAKHVVEDDCGRLVLKVNGED